MKKKLLSFCLFFCLSVLASQLPCAAAEVYPLNRGWTFHHGFQPVGEVQTVDLPHTWNKGDAMYGTADYYRGLCRYARPLAVPARWAGKRIFLRVEAAQTVADVFVDRRFVMQHRGGYTAFVAELTDFPAKRASWPSMSTTPPPSTLRPSAATSPSRAASTAAWSCW